MAMKKGIGLLLFWVCLSCMLSVSASQTVVSLQKGYEWQTKPSDGYPDGGGELTNGKYGTPVATGNVFYRYRDPEYIGFDASSRNRDGNLAVIVDLGEIREELYGFALSYLNETDAGIFAPVKVSFYISDSRAGEYRFVGECSLSEPVAKGSFGTGEARVMPKEAASGRFVLCLITPRDSYTDENGVKQAAGWTFLDELTVLQGKQPLQSEPDLPTQANGSASSVPQTGDRSILLFVLLCGISGLAVVALASRKIV